MSQQDSLFFYDLETSGIYPDSARIMQFAGQRTDLDLNPTDEPINYLIKLSEDILPDPSAVLVHGITPQQTRLEGLSEAEFLDVFYRDIVKPNTTFVGFNNVRFDDEFIRYLNFRNLYDPYAWGYENNCSRWDILDVVRLTRALRPEGINWPIDQSGKSVNRLELLTKANNIEHLAAHDALSDVRATIALSRLIKEKQPKLYQYLFNLRKKDQAGKLVNSNQPFIYTSAHYPSAQFHTTAVAKIADHPDSSNVMVFDLRADPSPWMNKKAIELAEAWRYKEDRTEDEPLLPVKTMKLNRCPAIAPLSVIKDKATSKRLSLDLNVIDQHYQILMASQNAFAKELNLAVVILNNEQTKRQADRPRPVDVRLYDGFYSDSDRGKMKVLHQNETADKIRLFRQTFSDKRLKQITSLYLARNYQNELTSEERSGWDSYLNKRLLAGGSKSSLAYYFQKITKLMDEKKDNRSQLLLEDLKLYGESLIPSDISEDTVIDETVY